MPSSGGIDGSHANSHTSESEDAANQTAVDNAEDDWKISWRALFFFTTRSNVPVLVAAVSISILAGAVVPASAYMEGKLIDGFTSYAIGRLDIHEFYSHQRKYVYYLLAVSGGTWLINFLEMMVWTMFGELQAKSARDRLFHGLLKKDIAWYDLRKHGIGALLPRIQAQIRELQLATSQPLGSILSLVSTAILSLVQALYISWDLTLVSIASTPIIMLAVLWAGRSVQKNYTIQQDKLTEAQKFSSSTFSSIETVKCFNAQKIEQEKYTGMVAEAARFYQKVARANALQQATIVLLSISMFVQAFYYCGVLIRRDKKSVADVLTTFFSAMGAFQALNGIIPALLFLQKGKIAGSTLRSIMAQMQSGDNSGHPDSPISPTGCVGDIEVRNLIFAYPALPEQLALDDVSLYIPGGEMTFLVGRSGSGKSTVGQLLMRFYNAQSGSISLDGVPIDHINTTWLRNNITLVEQTSTLFNDTIFNNIAFGRTDHDHVSREEVMEAVEFALLQSTVTDMSHGLDSVVGYKGGSLSGGQRQRMALARARVRDAPVLLLDESTSALDQVSRGLMMEAIRHWRAGKTTIVITHDISQIHPNDYAFILGKGKLVQEGYRKHMERSKHSPFQSFLDSERRAPTSPRNFSNEIAHEFNDERHGTVTDDPLESRLDASEAKRRTSGMFSLFKDRSPMKGVQAAAIDSPWLPLAGPSPLEVRRTSQPVNLPASWWSTKPGETASDEPGRRISQLLESLVDQAGLLAAESRMRSPGQRRHWKDMPPMSPIDEKPPSSPASIADITGSEEEESLVVSKSYKEILATVWPLIDSRTKVFLVLGFWGFTVHAICSPVFSYVLAKQLQTYSVPGGAPEMALLYALVMLGLSVISGFHTYLGHACMEYVGQKWVDCHRATAMQRILDQPRAFFDKEENSVSRLTGNLDRNAEEMRNLVGRFSGLVWTAVILSSVAVVWALIAQWKLMLISLTAAPYIYVVTKVYAAVSEKWESFSNGASEDAASVFTETFTNIKTVRALTLERHFVAKYTRATSRALNVGFRRAFLSGFFYGISDSAGNFATTLVFYVGTRLVKSGTPVQDVVLVLTMLMFTIVILSGLLVSIPQIASTKDTSSRLLRLVDLPEDSHEHLGHARITTVGEIVLEDLQFSYPSRPEHMVLKGINLRLRPGTSTAIVGASGSGKSTIANLLLNLYRTADTDDHGKSNGDVLLGGRGINHIDTRSLRAHLVPVSQTPTLFSASVAENIAYGLPADSPNASDTAIANAAEQAGIHDFIISLPQGYKTQIGDGGLGLSGGQGQCICIARALVRNPAVLILDEVTSALDTESAKQIRDTLEALVKDRGRRMTVVIITHHRAMMEIADNVVVLDDGRVVEEGEFEILAARNGALGNLLSGGEWTEER